MAVSTGSTTDTVPPLLEDPERNEYKDRRLWHLLCLFLVVGIALAWFAPVFQGKSFSDVGGEEKVVYPWQAYPNSASAAYPQSDQADLSFPWESELSQALRSGTVPLWNPDSFGGQPLFANGSSGLLSPLRLVIARFENPTTAHNLLSIISVVLAGVFMYLFLADLGLASGAATIGAVAWMLGSFTLVWLQLEVVAPLFPLIPAGMLSVRRAVLTTWRWVVLASVSIALLLISGHLLLAGLSTVSVFVYGLCLSISEGIRLWRHHHTKSAFFSLYRLSVTGVLAVGLSAFVLLPTARLLGYVGRTNLTYSELQQFLFPPSKLLYSLIHAPLPVVEPQMEVAVFMGTATAVLALLGFFSRHRGSGLGRGLVIVVLAVAIGGPVTWLVFHEVPGMEVFRPYSRLSFLIDFGTAVLAAVGLDVVLKKVSGRPSFDGRGNHFTSRQSSSSSGRRIRPRVIMSGLLAVSLIALTSIQLGSYGRKITPFEQSSKALQFPRTGLINAILRSQKGIEWPDRIISVRIPPTPTYYDAPSLFGDEPLVFGIQSAGGYDSSVPTRTVDLWSLVDGDSPTAAAGLKLDSAFEPAYGLTTVNYQLLPRVGVNRIVLTPAAAADPAFPISRIELLGWRMIYRGLDGVVLAWAGKATGPEVVFKSTTVSSDEQALKMFGSASFDATDSVVLESGSGEDGHGSYKILSTKSSYNDVTIRVQSTGKGWLVVPNMWDPGWSAAVNGAKTPVLRADYNLQAVRVKAGYSIIRLTYRPGGFGAGILLSALAAAACLGILLLPLIKRGRRTHHAKAKG